MLLNYFTQTVKFKKKKSDSIIVCFSCHVSQCRVNNGLTEWPEYNYTCIISREQCAHCRDFRCLRISGLYNEKYDELS